MPQTKSQTVQVQSVPGATVAFSSDETFCAVVYNGQSYNIRRPVLSPWAYTVTGHTWWVSPTGSDASAGTQAAPFATVNHAISVAVAGDCIYLLPGTYNQTVTFSTKNNIILSCAPKSAGGGLGTAIIAPDASHFTANPPSVPVVSLAAACYNLTINGLVIAGALAAGVNTPEHFDQVGICLSDGNDSGVRITNTACWGHSHCGVKEMSHGGSNYLLEGNLCFGNGTAGTDHGIYIPSKFANLNGNVCFLNTGAGLHLFSGSASHNVVIRNLCFSNTVWGILYGCELSTLLGNVVYGNGIGVLYFRALCNGNVAKNNIGWGNGSLDVSVDTAGSTGNVANSPPYDNIDNWNAWGVPYVYNVPPSVPPPGLYSAYGAKNLVGRNPLFVNAAAGDFSLQAGSPCIGAGDPAFSPNMGAF